MWPRATRTPCYYCSCGADGHITTAGTYRPCANCAETEVVYDRRTAAGTRDYAILLVTYGLRAREVAALTVDDLDWTHDQLRIPERKAGYSTAYPLSPTVGAALVEYLQHGRPPAADRRVFFRVLAPQGRLTAAGSDQASVSLS